MRRYHRAYHSSGHVWQGRFKAFPIQQDEHLLAVLRYVERNALRAKLVRRAEVWPWSSLYPERGGERSALLHPGPLPRPRAWRAYVNQSQGAAEFIALRGSVNRRTPFGAARWAERTARPARVFLGVLILHGATIARYRLLTERKGTNVCKSKL